MASSPAMAIDLDDRFDINSTTYPDGLLLESTWPDAGMRITIAGPEGFRLTQKYLADESIFIDINHTTDQVLADDRYRYEIRPVFAGYTAHDGRQEKQDFDKAQQQAAPRISPVNGSFLIVDGLVVDPELIEIEPRIERGTEK